MRIGRTLAPAAAPLGPKALWGGLAAMRAGEKAVSELRAQLGAYFGGRHCLCAGSGRAALSLVLETLHRQAPRRDLVLAPAWCCYSVAAAVRRAGLKLALCDIDAATLDFDFARLRPKLDDPALLAVIAVDPFGMPADIPRLRQLRTDPAVTIVEDAAQAFGAEYAGGKLGTRGDVGLFSFGRGKALTLGEGGLVVPDRDDLAALLAPAFSALPGGAARSLQLWGYALALLVLQHPALYWLPSAMPFLRLGESLYDPAFARNRFVPLQAGLARDWRERGRLHRAWRRLHAAEWASCCDRIGLAHYLRRGAEVPDLLRFPLRLTDRAQRDKLLAESRRQGLGIAPGYPAPLAAIPQLAAAFAGQAFPAATEVAATLLTLPVHPLLGRRDQRRIEHALCDLPGAAGEERAAAQTLRGRAAYFPEEVL